VELNPSTPASTLGTGAFAGLPALPAGTPAPAAPVAPVAAGPPGGGALTSVPRTTVARGPSSSLVPPATPEAVMAVVTPPVPSGVPTPDGDPTGGPAVHRRSPGLRLTALVAGMVATALAALVLAVTGPGSPPLLDVPWLVVLVAFIVGDRIDVNIDIRDGSLSMTLSHLVLVVGLFGVAPVPLVAARAVGGALSLLLLPDDRNWSKSIFNTALFLLEAGLAVVSFRFIAGGFGSPLEWRGWVAALVAIALCTVADAWLIVSAIRIAQPGGERVDVAGTVGLALAGEAVNASLGVLAAIVLVTAPRALFLLLPPAGLCLIAYRSHVMLGRRHERLQRMSAFTHALALETDLDEAIRIALGEATEALRAETAELLFLGGDDSGRAACWVGVEAGADVVRSLGQAATGCADPLLAQVIATHAPALRRRHDRAQRDAIAVPVLRGTTLLGVLAVRRHLGHVKTFGPDDMTALSTLANNAGVAFANCWLIDALRREAQEREHEALHDALTGLGNRRLFNERLDAALADARAAGSGLAVLLMDLNGFKDVNDTLGHAAGDRLLQTVADRLLAVAGNLEGVARLGGDEFAVLVAATTPAEACAVASRMLATVEKPVPIDGVVLAVSAAVGVACFPDHASEASVLLQRADMALYAAKERREQSIQLFSSIQGRASARRLTLAADLREALDTGTLDVHFQPQADLGSGEVLAVEALLRWDHPRFGPVPPEEVVGISEHLGLIDRLTGFVLERAIGQAAAWRRDGLDFDVAINISARNLLEPLFAAQLAIVLERHQVPAGRITLEITETELMTEAERAVVVLDRLHDLGVGLAIDDFGTGYSSLAYLRRLPVSEVKIDRSFVADLASDPSDAIIARTIVDLASNLSLRVVAEGIEDQRTWDLLEAMGCDRGQGYHLSRPASAEEITAWATARAGAR
jgi:diguanylate cyclase (GGDEF)-like protein